MPVTEAKNGRGHRPAGRRGVVTNVENNAVSLKQAMRCVAQAHASYVQAHQASLQNKDQEAAVDLEQAEAQAALGIKFLEEFLGRRSRNDEG